MTMLEKRKVTVLADFEKDEVEVLKRAIEAGRQVCSITIYGIMGWHKTYVSVHPSFFDSKGFKAFVLSNTSSGSDDVREDGAPRVTVSLGNPNHAGFPWSNYGETMDTLLEEQTREVQEYYKRKHGR